MGYCWCCEDFIHVVSECVHSAITITLHNQFKSEIETGGVGQRFITQEVQKVVESFEKDLEEDFDNEVDHEELPILHHAFKFEVEFSLRLHNCWMSTSDFTSIKNKQFHTAYLLIHILVATLLRNWYCAHQGT